MNVRGDINYACCRRRTSIRNERAQSITEESHLSLGKPWKPKIPKPMGHEMSIFFEVVPENKNYQSPKATNRAYSWRQSPKAQQIPKLSEPLRNLKSAYFPRQSQKIPTVPKKTRIHRPKHEHAPREIQKTTKKQRFQAIPYGFMLVFGLVSNNKAHMRLFLETVPKKTEPQKPIG